MPAMAAMARAVRVTWAEPTVKVMPSEKPRPQTRMTAAMMRLRLLVKSTLFSTRLRMPMAEIMPYRMKEMPPMMAEGMAPMKLDTTGKKEITIAKMAARRMTRGSYTRDRARTPVFSP